MFIDSHCHLGFKDLGNYNEETNKILNDAKINDVGIILDIATDITSFEKSIKFSQNKEGIFTAIGIHPLHIKDNLSFTKEDIIKHINNPKVIAVGETGLDYYYSAEEKDIQKNFFEHHLEICSKYNIPIIIHTRGAEEDTVDMLSHFVKNFGLRGVIHCFSGDTALAKKFLDIGFYISFSGIVTFKNAVTLQEVAKYVPSKKILTETDSPFLAPVPFRGKINKPSYVRNTAEFIAKLRGELISDFAKTVELNFFNLFNKLIIK